MKLSVIYFATAE